MSPAAARRHAGVVSASPTPQRNGGSHHSPHSAGDRATLDASSQAQQLQQHLAQIAGLRNGQQLGGRQFVTATSSPLATERSHLLSVEQAHIELLAMLNQQQHHQQHQHLQQQQQQPPTRNGTVASHKRARLSSPLSASSFSNPPPHPSRAHSISHQQPHHLALDNHFTAPFFSSLPPPPPPPAPHPHAPTHSHSPPLHVHRSPHTPQRAIATAATALHAREVQQHVFPGSSPPALLDPIAPFPLSAGGAAAGGASMSSMPGRYAPATTALPAARTSGQRRKKKNAAAGEVKSSNHHIAAALTADRASMPPVVPLAPLGHPITPLAPMASLAPLGPLPPVAPLGPSPPRSSPLAGASALSVVPLSSAAVVPVVPVRPLSPPPPPLLLFDPPAAPRRRPVSSRLRCAVSAAQVPRYVDTEVDREGARTIDGEQPDSANGVWCPASKPSSAPEASTSHSQPGYPHNNAASTCGCDSSCAALLARSSAFQPHPTSSPATAACSCSPPLLPRPSSRLCASLLSLYSIASSLPSAATVDESECEGWQEVLSVAAAAAVNRLPSAMQQATG